MPTRVLKVDGDCLDQPEFLRTLAHRVREHRDAGERVALVHGGAKEIAALHATLGLPYQKGRGLRATSTTSMDLVSMVLCGLVNKRVVALLNANGVPALGVSGADLGLLESRFLNYSQLGRVGGPPRVNRSALEALCGVGVLVIAPVCLAVDGGLANVSADGAAQAIAVALRADSLDFLTASVNTLGRRPRSIVAGEVDRLIRARDLHGQIVLKLQAGVAALEGGVATVRVGDLSSYGRGEAIEVRA